MACRATDLKSTMQALLAHPGTQYSAQLARQLYLHGKLHRFWTSFAMPKGGSMERWIRAVSPRVPKWLDHRTVSDVPAEKLRTIPALEIAAVLRMRFGAAPQIVMHARNEKFQRAIPKSEIEKSDVVIGFDTSSDILGERAAASGRPLILDQTIAHPRSKKRVYEAILRQFPDWSKDLEIRDSVIGAAEDAEHRKAGKVVVASSFTKSTLIENGVPAEKILLNPYGVDLERFAKVHSPPNGRPFRFLFAGLVCARKGIPLLLQAWDALGRKDAELWIAGPITPTAAARLPRNNRIKIMGKVPNSELAAVMSESDAFVFPSYFEGFALVLLEAMACGLPVITTTATAGPDILSNTENGWVLEPGNLDALVSTMRFCLEEPGKVEQMGMNARQTAERFSWNAYGNRWKDILDNFHS